MKQLAAILFAVCLSLLVVTTVHAQSLADIANQEKQRRESIDGSPAKITNTNVDEYTGGSVSTSTPIEQPSEKPDSENSEETAESAGEETKTDEPVDFSGRTESYWRETMTAARQKVENLEKQSTVLTLRLNDLENKFYNIDDGFDRDAVQKEMQKTYYEIDLNKENLAKAKEELADLEQDARKSGALPGWIE